MSSFSPNEAQRLRFFGGRLEDAVDESDSGEAARAKQLMDALSPHVDSLREFDSELGTKLSYIVDQLSVYTAGLSADLEPIAQDIEEFLNPAEDFYPYRAANAWARQAQDVVDVLAVHVEDDPSRDVLALVERSMELVARACLCSDTSSGYHVDVMDALMQLHVDAAVGMTPPLDEQEQSRLVRWLYDFRYSGEQDFFDPDIVDYAPVLGDAALDEYATLVEATDLEPYESFPLERIAVARGDTDSLEALVADYSNNCAIQADLVENLLQAGAVERAIQVGEDAVANAGSTFGLQKLVRSLSRAYEAAGRGGEIFDVYVRGFRKLPDAEMFAGLVSVAENLEGPARAEAERFIADEAEPMLAARDQNAFVRRLLGTGRDDEAWDFATTNTNNLWDTTWEQLAAARAKTHPGEVLSVYETLVEALLPKAAKQEYARTRDLLLLMRKAADDADEQARERFDSFRADVIQRSQRRPNAMKLFTQAGLA